MISLGNDASFKRSECNKNENHTSAVYGAVRRISHHALYRDV